MSINVISFISIALQLPHCELLHSYCFHSYLKGSRYLVFVVQKVISLHIV